MTHKIFLAILFLIHIGIGAYQDTVLIVPNQHNDNSIVYLFAHGLGTTFAQANLYATPFCQHPYPASYNPILGTPLVLFNFPDAKNDAMGFYYDQVNLGQTLDMRVLKNAYEKTRALFPQSKIVLFGLSRGAVTVINALATYDFPNLAAVIVEASFDEISSVIHHLIKRVPLPIPYAYTIACYLAKKAFPLLQMDGIFPINTIDKIPTNIPLLLIHSIQDTVIPVDAARRLFIKLQRNNHEHAYYLELTEGKHGRLICGRQQHLYQQTVHAFYKHYGLPYNQKLADNDILYTCKPSINMCKTLIEKRAHATLEIPIISNAYRSIKDLIKSLLI